jgi:hypothetical protein
MLSRIDPPALPAAAMGRRVPHAPELWQELQSQGYQFIEGR